MVTFLYPKKNTLPPVLPLSAEQSKAHKEHIGSFTTRNDINSTRHFEQGLH